MGARTTVVTFEGTVTNRQRVPDGTYRSTYVSVSLLAEPDDDDISLFRAAFDVAHTTVADPVDGMILAFRMVSATE